MDWQGRAFFTETPEKVSAEEIAECRCLLRADHSIFPAGGKWPHFIAVNRRIKKTFLRRAFRKRANMLSKDKILTEWSRTEPFRVDEKEPDSLQ